MPETEPWKDAARGPRLQKVMAAAGIGARRQCEELITAGEVTVNGHLVTTLPVFVDPAADRIVVRGRALRQQALVYVMLFKPRGVVSTSADEQGRRIAADLVRHPSRARLFPVGRLDMESSGLLLLTNDGELTNRLTHPRYELSKIYEVAVKGALDADQLAKLEKGIFLADRRRGGASRTRGSRIRIVKRDHDRTLLAIELSEGRNRQVRRMMQQVGHPVKKLRRVQTGPLKLKGLRPGEWRDLTPAELGALKREAYRRFRPSGPGPRSAPGKPRRADPPGE